MSNDGFKVKGRKGIHKIIGVSYTSARVMFEDDGDNTYPAVRWFKVECPKGSTDYVHPDDLTEVES